MRKNQETVEGLLHCLDNSIEDYDRRIKVLDKEYNVKNDSIVAQYYSEYKKKKKEIEKRYAEEAVDCQRKLDHLCQRIRRAQPALVELSSDNLNKRGRFPRYIAFGKLHVTYKNLDFYVPNMFSFPFERPMFICDDTKVVLLHKILLRLLYTLPFNKQEYYVFDPIGLGKTVSKFNSLFSSETVFPDKQILISTDELKTTLKKITRYILNLQSNVFNIENDCQDWDSYNRRLYSQNAPEKCLPYKIFIFTSVPNKMDEECFNMFKTLILHGKQCGILVLFSFDETILTVEDNKIKRMEVDLKSYIKESIQLHNVIETDLTNGQFSKLNVENVGEKFPDDLQLNDLLISVKEEIDKAAKKGVSFDDLVDTKNLFNSKSTDGLEIPIGWTAVNNRTVTLSIGDAIPHYLIGGTTGSGKSNLLHNLIMSACCRYSPEELRIYLLDFKEGVEFSQYANPPLKQALLVATEADTEYGITVLEHITKEKEIRYEKFKQVGCKDIQGYRQMRPDDIMPRILVIIDEFQLLFGNQEQNKTLETMEMIAKQGRGCGIHMVLATQSLTGIPFATLGSQFGGRIALKCSADDSKKLLGGTSSTNEAASELKIPFAIVNTSQGSISGNVKFMIPKAEQAKITEVNRLIERKCDQIGITTKTKIFDGQKLPVRPKEIIRNDLGGFQICFGEKMDYDAKPFILNLNDRAGENLLLCGQNKNMKSSMLNSVIYSGLYDKDLCQKIIYIGNDANLIDMSILDSIHCYTSLKDFCENYLKTADDKKLLLIIDNCNLIKQIGYPEYGTPKSGSDADFFKNYLSEAGEKGSHTVAFYDGFARIKSFGLPKDDFKYKIGFEVSAEDKNKLVGITFMSNEPVKKNRAFFVENDQLNMWFRPYAL